MLRGEEKQIKEFIEFVKSEKPEKAIVEEIKVEEYEGAVRSIESYRNSFMVEQMNELVQVGLNMLETQNRMLEKQDETIKVIKEESEKKSEKTRMVVKEESEKTREHIGKKIDESKEYLGDKIDALRGDLKSYLEEKLKKIEKEIEAIKAKIGMS